MINAKFEINAKLPIDPGLGINAELPIDPGLWINAKVKAFRAQFRGVRDIPFFIFRLTKLFA